MSDNADVWEVTDDFKCPKCQAERVVPVGPSHSPILLVGDEPTKDELSDGYPFSGPSGNILRVELAFIGIDIKSCRRMLLMPHIPPKKKDLAICSSYWMEQVIKEAKNHKLIILFGAQPTRAFLDDDLSVIAGLIRSSNYFSAPALPMVKPGSVFSTGVGEFRFCIKQLKKAVLSMNLFDGKFQEHNIQNDEEW